MTDQLALTHGFPEGPVTPGFRPIHYLGAKSRLLDDIAAAVDLADPSGGPVLDLFAGSGVVSARFAHERDVVAVDIQEYSRALCSALLDPAVPEDGVVAAALSAAAGLDALVRSRSALSPLVEYEEWATRAIGHEPELLCALVEHGSLAVAERLAARPTTPQPFVDALDRSVEQLSKARRQVVPWSIAYHYGGVYFSYRQALELDVLLAASDFVPARSRDTWTSAILSTASEIVTSVGNQFAQPIRPRSTSGAPKLPALRAICRQRERDALGTFRSWLRRYAELPHSERNHFAIRADFAEYLSSQRGRVSVVYADPPYTRDHYSRFYHVLETMARRDSPGISTMRIGRSTQPSRGIYRLERHQSPFCIKSQAPTAFRALFGGVRAREVPLVLSYSPYASDKPSHPRLLTVDEVESLAREHFSVVQVETVETVAHSKFNAAHLNFDRLVGAEVLFLCRP